jgi:hypothetical protein
MLGAKFLTAFPRRRRTSPGASWLELVFRETAAASIRRASTIRYAGTIVRSWGAIDAGDTGMSTLAEGCRSAGLHALFMTAMKIYS